MTEFFSGQFLQSVKNQINNSGQKEFWMQVCKDLSVFHCKNNILNSEDNEQESAIFSVIDNQLSRGLPTLSSINIERQFAETFGLTVEETSIIGSLSFNFTTDATDFLRCLVIADNRTTELNNETTFQTWEEHGGSDFEKVFFENLFQQFGNKANQLLQLQRTITSILEGSIAGNDLFYEQTTDFFLEFPKAENFSNGLVIEIDGRQHEVEPQKSKDNLRNHFTSEKGFQTVRIKTTEVNNIPEEKKNIISHYLLHPYSQSFLQNISSPLFNSEEDLDYLQLFLSPIGIARIQKAFVKAIKKNMIDLTKENLSIAIIERDLPCGKYAIADLLIQIENLSLLQNGEKLSLPNIEINIFNTAEFANCKLNQGNDTQLYSDQIDFTLYDLTIDISILNNSTFLNKPTRTSPNNTIVIRSIHHTEEKRKFNFYPTITYRNVPIDKEDERVIPLTFFLQSLFRKESFREGQVEILSKALERRNPIALLPTGAGKSLTYQIASLLQPGLTIVVDPIKALMKDQDDNLKNASIDGTVYINSTLPAKLKAENIRKYADGEFLFAFVSPERFVIDDFRRAIQDIQNRNFSYCVIDEAHCVSEWGHDFRTAYLKLGENSRKFCFSGHEGENISTLGLTGTASFDVLSDVQREVGLQNQSDIIRPKKLEREELKFKIKNVTANTVGVGRNFWDITKSVYTATEASLLQILQTDLMTEFNTYTFPDFIKPNGDESNCGIIFCPKGKGKYFSVESVASFLRTRIPAIANLIGEYYGSGDDKNKNLEKIQDDFKNNKITLLVATKAYGMGIDKPNIRFTAHITHPISIEGFYQEAGRAGRDRKKAVCYIQHCNNLKLPSGKNISRDIQDSFLFNAFKGNTYEKNITFELLDKITFPHTPIKNQIEVEVSELTQLEFRIGKPYPAPPQNPHTIYINGLERNQTVGEIRIQSLQISTARNNCYTTDEALSILTNIVQVIERKKPANVSLTDWLDIKQVQKDRDGIESFIETILNNETKSLTIGLENGGIQEVVNYLSNQFNPRFHYDMVKAATNFCKNDIDYIGNLEWRYKDEFGIQIQFTTQQKTNLTALYSNIRLNQDTQKIIYRLSVLGVVDDYTIQYPSLLTAICKNINDEDIFINLHKHYKRYYPENYVNGLMTTARNSNFTNGLRKCINSLIDFTYDNVFDKRLKALDNIENAIEKAITETRRTNEANGNIIFKQIVDDYFDSQFVEEIRIISNFGELTDYSVFQHFAEIATNIDQLRQLENSARRVLEAYNRNPVISLLEYYSATLLKNISPSLLYETVNLYRENEFTFDQIDEIINNISTQINQHDTTAGIINESNINSVLSNFANESISTFNQNFLEQNV